jgi:hypothetical protein
MAMKNIIYFFIFFLTPFVNINAQRQIIIKDSSSQKSYIIATNKTNILYSLKSNPSKYFYEKIISFDSLGIIFDNENFKPIHYSDFNSFAFKSKNNDQKFLNRATLFTAVSMDLFIYISTKKQNQYVGYYIFSISAIMYGATIGLINLTYALTNPTTYLHNLQFKNFALKNEK